MIYFWISITILGLAQLAYTGLFLLMFGGSYRKMLQFSYFLLYHDIFFCFLFVFGLFLFIFSILFSFFCFWCLFASLAFSDGTILFCVVLPFAQLVDSFFSSLFPLSSLLLSSLLLRPISLPPSSQCQFTPTKVPVLVWAYPKFAWLRELFDCFNLNPATPSVFGRDVDPLYIAIRRKMKVHGGFIVESLVESIPQSILQMIAIVQTGVTPGSLTFSCFVYSLASSPLLLSLSSPLLFSLVSSLSLSLSLSLSQSHKNTK